MDQNAQKQRAALAALDEVQDGMTVGLGTGSTATFFIQLLKQAMMERHWQLTTVASSTRSADMARSLGITVKDIDEVDNIDVTIDGADECDWSLNGIKGGGAPLLYEKVLAVRSNRNIWIIDDSKLSEQLGQFRLPVEVIPFGAEQVFNRFQDMGLAPSFRMTNIWDRLVTDAGHHIIDLDVSNVNNPYRLADDIKGMTGVVEHGFFLDICDRVIIGTDPIQTMVRPVELKQP